MSWDKDKKASLEQANYLKEHAESAAWFTARMASLTEELKTAPTAKTAAFIRQSISKALRFHAECTTPPGESQLYQDREE